MVEGKVVVFAVIKHREIWACSELVTKIFKKEWLIHQLWSQSYYKTNHLKIHGFQAAIFHFQSHIRWGAGCCRLG